MPKNLKYLSLTVLALLTVFMIAGCFPGRKYAAKVNDTYITKVQYEKSVTEVISYYENTARKLKETEKTALRQETLDRLIYEELIIEEAQKRGIATKDKQVDDFINGIKKSIGDEKKFQSLIKERSYSEQDYRDRLKMKYMTQDLSAAVTKSISDPLAKKQAFDKFMQNVKQNATIKIYAKFN